MKWVHQALAASRVSVRCGIAAPRHFLLIFAGALLATLVLIALLTIPDAISRAAATTGSDDVVLLVPRGTEDVGGAVLPGAYVSIVSSLPGVREVAPVLVVTRKLRRADGTQTDVLIRGVTRAGLALSWPAIIVAQGRAFGAGGNEVIVGREAARAFPQLTVGARVRIARTLWHVAGEFSAGGSLWESEIWVPLSTLQSSVNAPGRISAVWVELVDPRAYSAFRKALAADPRLEVHAERQRTYYEHQVKFLSRLARLATWGVAVLLGLAAIATIGNAVSLGLVGRLAEISILRMLGFGNSAVIVSLVVETLFICWLGALVAVGLGWLSIREIVFITWSGNHAITITPSIHVLTAITAVGYALVLGVLSAIATVAVTVCSPLATEIRDGCRTPT